VRFLALFDFGPDRVLQRLRAENSSLDAVDVVREGSAFGQLFQLLRHAGHGRGQKGSGMELPTVSEYSVRAWGRSGCSRCLNSFREL